MLAFIDIVVILPFYAVDGGRGRAHLSLLGSWQFLLKGPRTSKASGLWTAVMGDMKLQLPRAEQSGGS